MLNRFAPRTLSIDEASIKKALTVPIKWKIPSDYPATASAQNTAIPLVVKGFADFKDDPTDDRVGNWHRRGSREEETIQPIWMRPEVRSVEMK